MEGMEHSVSPTDSNSYSLARLDEAGNREPRISRVIANNSNFKEEDRQDEDGTTEWKDHAPKRRVPKRRTRRKNDGILAAISQWIVEHQVGK